MKGSREITRKIPYQHPLKMQLNPISRSAAVDCGVIIFVH
jgi:hypothetical protein